MVCAWNSCIDDLEKNIKSRVQFYADDAMLFSIVQGPYISAAVINDDLKAIKANGFVSGGIQPWRK